MFNIKRLILLLLCSVGFLGWHLLKRTPKNSTTSGFSIQEITSTFPGDPRWASSCDVDLHEILAQKFSYLGKGTQCFAFVSEDNRYVLKFFKQRKFTKNKFISQRGKRKREMDFSSYKIAYELLREETGLLFSHLVLGDGFHAQVTLVDHAHTEHHIDLGNFEFVLQKRAADILPTIVTSMNEHGEEEAKKVIDGIFDFFHRRLDKGIVDLDPTIGGNLGVIEGTVVQIDVGRFVIPDSPKLFRKEWERFMFKNRSFCTWLQENYPSLYAYYLEQCLELEKRHQSIATDRHLAS